MEGFRATTSKNFFLTMAHEPPYCTGWNNFHKPNFYLSTALLSSIKSNQFIAMHVQLSIHIIQLQFELRTCFMKCEVWLGQFLD